MTETPRLSLAPDAVVEELMRRIENHAAIAIQGAMAHAKGARSGSLEYQKHSALYCSSCDELRALITNALIAAAEQNKE